MRYIFLQLLTFCFFGLSASNSSDTLYLDKVETLDATIKNIYGVISGEIGEPRDWDLMRYLFHPEAKLIASGMNKEGQIKVRYLTVEDYIESSGPYLIEKGFFEKEIHREEDRFGNISQVFSTYEAFHSESETEPFMRGINSIQLLYDDKRWWIINIYWTQESKMNPIPDIYLPK